MSNIKTGFLRLAIVLIFGLVACEDPEPFSGTICLRLEHHGVPHFGASVYKNFGPDFPGYNADMKSSYDSYEETGQGNQVCFDNLGVGSYWFAAEGYDEFIQDSVRGSLYLELGTRQPQVDTVIRVSEQH